MGVKSFYGYLKLGVGQLYAGSIGQHESHCDACFVDARVLAVLPPEIIVVSIEAYKLGRIKRATGLAWFLEVRKFFGEMQVGVSNVGADGKLTHPAD
ncbi:hypothetical protein [Pseudomonas aeruginosa]|uniref:hypothetical protein n=1 Tax=Pseudomonas aeruginosa TaxID=287 RepID=UPI0037607D16